MRQSGGDHGARDRCPSKFKATVTGPTAGIEPGSWLDLTLDQTREPPRVVFSDTATGRTVGSLTAVPDLDVFIECLRSSVAYRAHVEGVSGGRVDVTVVKQ